jgi:hypothetical protein
LIGKSVSGGLIAMVDSLLFFCASAVVSGPITLVYGTAPHIAVVVRPFVNLRGDFWFAKLQRISTWFEKQETLLW